jgi:hypothetical protein
MKSNSSSLILLSKLAAMDRRISSRSKWDVASRPSLREDAIAILPGNYETAATTKDFQENQKSLLANHESTSHLFIMQTGTQILVDAMLFPQGRHARRWEWIGKIGVRQPLSP